MNVKTTLNQAAPYIFYGTGVASLVGAVVCAVRATTKLGYILDDYKNEKADIDEIYEDERKEENLGEETALSIKKKEERRLNMVTFCRIARLYAPTAAFTGLSVASFGVSVGMFRGKYLAAQTALCGVTEAFDTYRSRVIEAEGEEKDRIYMYGQDKEKISVKNPETGKSEKKEVYKGSPRGIYCYPWEKYDPETGMGSVEFDPSPTLSHMTIVGRIKTFQNSLDAGNEVRLDRLLDDIGFRDKRQNGYAEAIAGWKPGDVIKCGLEPEATMSEDALRFCCGETNEFTLCFNCRPDIFGVTERPMIEAKTEAGKALEDAGYSVIEEGEF